MADFKAKEFKSYKGSVILVGDESSVDELRKIIEITSDFVKETCTGRPDHHGFPHASQVLCNSFNHYRELYPVITPENVENYGILVTVAMLHDVNDQKFFTSFLEQKLLEFVKKLWPTKYEVILEIIENVSFSKEAKRLKKDEVEPDSKEAFNYWVSKFKNLAEIRNIVSDEDKLLASGFTGYERCLEYTSELYFEKHGTKIPPEVCMGDIVKHADEKLFILPKYMRTERGQRLIKNMDLELRFLINCLQKKIVPVVYDYSFTD